MNRIKKGIIWFLTIQIIVVIDIYINHRIDDSFLTLLSNSQTIPLLMILGLLGYIYAFITYLKEVSLKTLYTKIERLSIYMYTSMFVTSAITLIIERFESNMLTSTLLIISFYVSILSMLVLMFIHMGLSGMKKQTRHLIYLVTLIVLLVLHIRVNSSVLISYMMMGLMLLWQYQYLDPKTKTDYLYLHLNKKTLRK